MKNKERIKIHLERALLAVNCNFYAAAYLRGINFGKISSFESSITAYLKKNI